MNCFHPDYVKTYMPEFLTKLVAESNQYENGVKFGGMSRATRESEYAKSVNTISTFPKTKRISTKVTEFHIYSKAGMPKVKK